MKFSWSFFLTFCMPLTALFGYEIMEESESTKRLGYGDWYINTDGEERLMQQLLRPGDVVFDVGANVGEWSQCALKTESSIQLYAFEPLPGIFSDLQSHLAARDNVKVFHLAFGDRTGKMPFHHYDETYEFSGLSGFFVREVLKAEHQPPKEIEVEVDTITNFCSENHIDSIDFLKIDAEGAEWVILKGAEKLINEGKIGAIQFEYGGCYVDAHTKLKDIYDLLIAKNYAIFRIMPHGLIRIAQWNDWLENFDLCNYFAIKKEIISTRL